MKNDFFCFYEILMVWILGEDFKVGDKVWVGGTKPVGDNSIIINPLLLRVKTKNA